MPSRVLVLMATTMVARAFHIHSAHLSPPSPNEVRLGALAYRAAIMARGTGGGSDGAELGAAAATPTAAEKVHASTAEAAGQASAQDGSGREKAPKEQQQQQKQQQKQQEQPKQKQKQKQKQPKQPKQQKQKHTQDAAPAAVYETVDIDANLLHEALVVSILIGIHSATSMI